MRQASGMKWTTVKAGKDGRYAYAGWPIGKFSTRKLEKIAAYLAGIAALLMFQKKERKYITW